MQKHFVTSIARSNEPDPYGLVSPGIFSDPHPIYHILRYSEPVYSESVDERLGNYTLR